MSQLSTTHLGQSEDLDGRVVDYLCHTKSPFLAPNLQRTRDPLFADHDEVEQHEHSNQPGQHEGV